MTVFVAGGSGTIGAPLVRALVGAGHRVVATTRSAGKRGELEALGAAAVVVDALDADALTQAVRTAAPTHVIHELTALPKTGVRRARDLDATNRLRDEGTRNLLEAAIAAGATRFIAGSFAPIGSAPPPMLEAPDLRDAVKALQSMESQVLEAARTGAIEGVVLRYGLFYGPSNPATREMISLVRRRRLPMIRGDDGVVPFIHMDDAVSATVAALDCGASDSVYDIVDDTPASFSEMVREMAAVAGAPRPFTAPFWLIRLLMPYAARMLTLKVPVSNAKARAELHWRPRFPSYREGLRDVMRNQPA